MRTLLPSFVLSILATAALAQEPSKPAPLKFDIVLCDPPAGWTHQEADGKLVLEPDDKSVKVEVARSQPLGTTLEKRAELLLAEAGKRNGFRQEAEPNGGRHTAAKGQWRMVFYSFSNPDKNDAFLYHLVLLVSGGGRFTTFTMSCGDAKSYAAHRQEFSSMVDGVRLTTTQRLEKGSPALSRYMLDETIDFLEWLVQSPMTEVQKATAEAEIRGYWRDKVQAEIDGMVELMKARVQLAAMQEAERELARVTVLEEALKSWRKDDSLGAKMMLAIYDDSHKPIAAGEPPLTQQAVDAYAEFLNFAACKVAGAEAKLPKDTRSKLTQAVAEGWGGMNKEARDTVASMPMVWAALRVLWPQLQQGQQQQYVAAWKKDASIGKLATVVKDLAAAQSSQNLLQLQAQLQAQNMYYQTMSNVMRMQYETSRIIIGNMGGNTSYRYEYRW